MNISASTSGGERSADRDAPCILACPNLHGELAMLAAAQISGFCRLRHVLVSSNKIIFTVLREKKPLLLQITYKLPF
jgi:hypothetical protein